MRSLFKYAAFLAGTAFVAFVFQLHHDSGTRSWIMGAMFGGVFGGTTAYSIADSLTEPIIRRQKIQYTPQEKRFWMSYYAVSIGLIYSYFGMVWFSMLDEGLFGMAVGFLAGAAQSAVKAHMRLQNGKVKRVQRPFAWTALGIVIGLLYGAMAGMTVAHLYRAETLWAGAIGGAIYGAMHGLALGGYLSLLNSKTFSIDADSFILNLIFSGITAALLFAVYLLRGGMWQAVILTLCFGFHLLISAALAADSIGLSILVTMMVVVMVGGIVHSQWSERVLHWQLEADGVQTWATFDGCDCNRNSCWLKATYQIDDNQTLTLREDVYRGICYHKEPEIRVTYLPNAPRQASVKSHSSAGLGWLLALPFFSFMLLNNEVAVIAGVAEPKKKKK